MMQAIRQFDIMLADGRGLSVDQREDGSWVIFLIDSDNEACDNLGSFGNIGYDKLDSDQAMIYVENVAQAIEKG